jgi:hypothetical protein
MLAEFFPQHIKVLSGLLFELALLGGVLVLGRNGTGGQQNGKGKGDKKLHRRTLGVITDFSQDRNSRKWANDRK